MHARIARTARNAPRSTPQCEGHLTKSTFTPVYNSLKVPPMVYDSKYRVDIWPRLA